jgi:hypothetical protein
MMVPVFYDLGRKKIKVWAFLGWRSVSVAVAYHERPRVLLVDPAPGPRVEFCGDQYELATPVLAEVYVERLLNRDEFRAHCDRHRTRSAILANLR